MIYFDRQRMPSELLYATVCATFVLLMSACAAASRGPDAAKPRTNEPPYPIILAASEETRQRSLAAWTALTQSQGIVNAPAPELQPVTATISALPPTLPTPLQLPKVETGLEGMEAAEEETREALRRFMGSASTLLGINLGDISLVEQVDEKDQTKKARYQQKPFLYPLRADYGMLDISFTPDGRVLRLSSTAIPDAERINRALTAFRDRMTAEQAAARLQGQSFTYTDATGKEATYTVTAPDEVRVREIVVYPLQRSANDTTSLEFHLAWEIAVRPSAPLLVYLDSVTGEVIAATSMSPK